MTTPATARKVGPLLGTGLQTSWPFNFKVFAAGDIAVTIANSAGVETQLVLNSDFSVALNANQETSPGGTVTYPISGAPLPTGSRLSIFGALDYDQPLDLPGGGNFNPVAIENALDRAVMQIQQLAEESSRSAKLPVTNGGDAESLVADIVRLADSADNIDTAANNIAAITTVAADLNEPVSEINTVAGSIANVDAVGTNIGSVNTVAGISGNVTTVAGIAGNVNTVAAVDNEVAAVAGIAGAVVTVAGIAADVVTVADNLADVTNFADVYLGAKAADPTTRNDGSPLHAGDLYFSTTGNTLRAYTGVQWVSGTAGSVSVQRFSGTGAAVNFALSEAPASENNTQVFISGVYQQKDTYSVAGATLTFSVAPPLGTDNIEVVTLSTLALGETDASLVSFVQSGAGAVQRTVADKAREIVSVADYGSSLTVALAAIGGVKAKLVINRAVSVTADLTVPENVLLEFTGTGVVNVSANKRLRVNGGVLADRKHQCFNAPLLSVAITASINGNALNVSAVSEPLLTAGQVITGAGLPFGLAIGQAYGAGGVDQYALNNYAGIVSSQAMTVTGPSVIFGAGSVGEVYPQWFGAKGDGAADDTDAIRHAIYSQPWGGRVRIPAGKYKITGRTLLHSGLTIEGDGAMDPSNGAPPTNQVSQASHLFTGGDNLSIFTISGRTDYPVIKGLLFSAASALGLSPVGTGRSGITFTGHGGQFVFNPQLLDCYFFNFQAGVEVIDTWASTYGDGVAPSGYFWNGTANEVYYDWAVNPGLIDNCQFRGNTIGVYFETSNADAFRIVNCVFILPANSSGVRLKRCGFIKLDTCFAFGASNSSSEFIHLTGFGTGGLDSVVIDNCQAEYCSHFIEHSASSTNTPPVAITARNCIHQLGADVYLGHECEYNSYGSEIQSFVYVDAAGVKVNSFYDRYFFQNYSTAPTWGVVVVGGDANSLHTYVPGKQASSLTPGPIFNGAPHYALTGTGSPVGAVTPKRVGQEYLDTAGGGKWWKAIGLTAADWQAIS